MNIFVKNLDESVNDVSLEGLFMRFGEVDNAFVVRDKFTKESRGFGFVTMNDSGEAEKAIENLNGFEHLGKELIVEEAEPPKPKFKIRF